MTIEETIQKAIDGGWEPSQFILLTLEEPDEVEGNWDEDVTLRSELLDPNFWRALDKGMGVSALKSWDSIEKSWKYYKTPISNLTGGDTENAWRVAFHQFVDHLVDGGTIESFFEKL